MLSLLMFVYCCYRRCSKSMICVSPHRYKPGQGADQKVYKNSLTTKALSGHENYHHKEDIYQDYIDYTDIEVATSILVEFLRTERKYNIRINPTFFPFMPKKNLLFSHHVLHRRSPFVNGCTIEIKGLMGHSKYRIYMLYDWMKSML